MSVHTTTVVGRAAFLAVAAIATIALLAGCSSPTGAPSTTIEGDWSTLTLAEAKLPAQLLRNETVNRIPSDAVTGAANQTDGSVACLKADVDPQETIRQWRATVDVVLTSSAAADADAITATLIKSFTDLGWMGQSITGTTANGRATLLTIATSDSEGVRQSQLRIEAQPQGDGAVIHIESNSDCVVTGGKDSAEVKELGVDAS
jgi:hypothetical protein